MCIYKIPFSCVRYLYFCLRYEGWALDRLHMFSLDLRLCAHVWITVADCRITVGQGGQTHTHRMWIRRLCPTTSQILLHHGRSYMGHLTNVTQLVTQHKDIYALCALLDRTMSFLTTKQLTGILISHCLGYCMFWLIIRSRWDTAN